MPKTLLLGSILAFGILAGCGEKEEVNPQVVNNPSPELIEKARAAGGDLASPTDGGSAPANSLR